MRGSKPHLVVNNDAVTKAPAVPGWLSVDAKKEWRRVLPVLMQRRILTTPDLASLENYCTAIGQVREMERLLQRDGHVISDDGKLKRHPAVGIQSDAMTRARLLAAVLGLTPVDRSRPAIREDGDDDQFDPLNVS